MCQFSHCCSPGTLITSVFKSPEFKKKQSQKKNDIHSPLPSPPPSTCKLENLVLLQTKGEKRTDFPTSILNTPPALLRNRLTTLLSLPSPLDATNQPRCNVCNVGRWEKVPAIQCQNTSTHKIPRLLILLQQQQWWGWREYRWGQVWEPEMHKLCMSTGTWTQRH